MFNKVIHFFINAGKTLVLPVSVYVAIQVLALVLGKSFGTPRQIYGTLQMTIRPMIIAFGMSFIMQSGRWDFSCGAQVLLIALLGETVRKLLSGIIVSARVKKVDRLC